MAGLGFGQSSASQTRDSAIAHMIDFDTSLTEEACLAALDVAAGSVPRALNLLFSEVQGPQLRQLGRTGLRNDDAVRQSATPARGRAIAGRRARTQTPPPKPQRSVLPSAASHPAPLMVPHCAKPLRRGGQVAVGLVCVAVVVGALVAVGVVVAHAYTLPDVKSVEAAQTVLSAHEHVHGIDYSQLTQEQAEDLRSRLRAEYAAVAGVAVTDVDIALSQGSVRVHAKIKAQSGSDAERARSILDFSKWLSLRVHMHVYCVGKHACLANILGILQRAVRDLGDHAVRLWQQSTAIMHSSARRMLATASTAIMTSSSLAWAAFNRHYDLWLSLMVMWIISFLCIHLAAVWNRVRVVKLDKERKKHAEELKKQAEELKKQMQQLALARLAMPFSYDPPAYWKWQGYRTGDMSQAAPSRVRCPEMDSKVTDLLRMTASHPHGCPGRDGSSEFLDHVQSVCVWRLEHPFLWEQYRHRLETMKKTLVMNNVDCQAIHPEIHHHELLDASVNEVMLWHGTKSLTVNSIAATGFDERVCSLNGLYGAGLYFACESCKAGQYAPDSGGVHHFFYCRVILGNPYYTSHQMNGYRRPPQLPGHAAASVLYDSVVVNHTACQVHREFIVYDRCQAYPEFLVEVNA